MPRLFALDHNFPQPIVDVLAEFQEDAELVRIDQVHPDMPDLDDWQVLLALLHDARDWDGLITTDSSILNQPLELSVLIQTKLTLVVALEAGHNPVKATGLLFAYLESICQRTDPGRPQVWKPTAANRPHVEPWEELARVAKHQHRDAKQLFDDHRLSPEALAKDPLDR
jgi:hypothetical protein